MNATVYFPIDWTYLMKLRWVWKYTPLPRYSKIMNDGGWRLVL
jgi:hypothetical protein